MRALVGHTGFVGGNLLNQTPFDELYNSRNIEDIAGRELSLLVCAGVPAVKWLANRNPEEDRRCLERLFSALAQTRCDDIVLISTIDVYPVTRDADESFDCHFLANHAYGAHRLWLEDRVRDHFERATVVRLPAVFGPGLKKNVLYDLLHDNCLDAINPTSSFQWYGIDRLWDDVTIARDTGIPLVNLFPEPLATSRLLQRFFPQTVVGAQAAEAHYDLRSQHAGAFGGRDGYIEDAGTVLKRMGCYLAWQRSV